MPKNRLMGIGGFGIPCKELGESGSKSNKAWLKFLLLSIYHSMVESIYVNIRKFLQGG